MGCSEPNLAQLRNARFLLEQLADGIDPATRRPLPRDHEAQDPDCIRAIFRTSRLLHGIEAEFSASFESRRPPNLPERARAEAEQRAGQPWTQQEDRTLADAFEKAIPLHSMARLHSRSRGGIIARLVFLKLVRTRQEARALLRRGRQKP